MAKKIVNTNLTVILLLLVGFMAYSMLANAGNLEPSGPPGPTMKTLQEVEPRIPISQSDVPKTILAPGSYYLTENLQAVGIGTHVIEIGTHDVTLDMMGFTIIGSNFETFAADNGIVVTQTDAENIVIKNGVVRFCIQEGIDAFEAVNSQILNIRAFDNTGAGIVLGNGLVWQCVAESNNSGIRVGAGSSVIQCTARYNTGAWAGIYTNNQCLVTDCTAMENNNHGIRAGADCIVTNNTASKNTGNGIFAAASQVCGNTANRNTTNGIEVSFHCLVKDNLCALNTEAGILATDFANRIDGNQTSGNDIGIDVDDAPNLIVRNSSIGGSPEFDIIAGNKVGATSTNPATAGPWDNLDF
jgi:parallel beta-helix repeat protein